MKATKPVIVSNIKKKRDYPKTAIGSGAFLISLLCFGVLALMGTVKLGMYLFF